MTASAPVPAVPELGRVDVGIARHVVTGLGGRYSRELGIDVDRGEDEIERWFLAATLFGARISASVAARTFGVLDAAGLTRIGQARHIPWNELVALLDQGGYARYDFRTATRLQALSEVVDDRYEGEIAEIGRRFKAYAELRVALDSLPGWGPVTIGLFLRELRGVWPGAVPPLDDRAESGARHLGLLDGEDQAAELDVLADIAAVAVLDLRDLESGLVRLTLAHHGDMGGCPGGPRCMVLAGRGGSDAGRRDPPSAGRR